MLTWLALLMGRRGTILHATGSLVRVLNCLGVQNTHGASSATEMFFGNEIYR